MHTGGLASQALDGLVKKSLQASFFSHGIIIIIILKRFID